MLLGLSLVNSFGALELSLIGVLPVTLDGLMFVTGEGYLVVLSPVIPIVSSTESINYGSVLCNTP